MFSILKKIFRGDFAGILDWFNLSYQLNQVKNVVKEEFVEIIEWLDNTPNTIVWKFPSTKNDIKNGAKLVVRASQTAVLVQEGQFADDYVVGTHTLFTENMPLLTKLKSWKYGFDSPFKVDVYFVNLRPFPNLDWKTEKPFIVKDAEMQHIRLKASGKFAMRITDARLFLREVNGTNAQMTVADMVTELQTAVATKFIDTLAESQINVSDLAANYLELGERLLPLLKDDFVAQGIEITKFYIQSITLPPEVEAFLDKKAQFNLVKGEIHLFTQLQNAEASAKNAQPTTHIILPESKPLPAPQTPSPPKKKEINIDIFKTSVALLDEFKSVVEATYWQITIPMMESDLPNEFVRATLNFYVQMTKGCKKVYEENYFGDWTQDPVYQKAYNEYTQLAQSGAHMDYKESMKYADFHQRINERYAEYIQKKASAYVHIQQQKQLEIGQSSQQETLFKALNDLGNLRQTGVLTEAEFEQQKAALLKSK
ncbi:MAG: hypothetical protein RL757_2630 [Bacteroidota bacterium]|jgi:membrane protease subunit (stomatin/prohibitin family)